MDARATGSEAIAGSIEPASKKRGWSIASFDSEEPDEGRAAWAIDGNPRTFWHTAWSRSEPKCPHEIVINLGKEETIKGVAYLPRQNGVNGRVGSYEIYVGTPGHWDKAVASGEFDKGSDEVKVLFNKTIATQYVRFVALSELNKGPWTSIAELDILRG